MKKGFTLIELLAVIVILAIIATIATPIVLSIINETKESATLRSAEFYLDAVEQNITKKSMAIGSSYRPNTCEVQSDGNLLCDEKDILEVKVKGEKPSSGTITFENTKISEVSLILGNKMVVKNETGQLELKTYIEACTYDDVDSSGTINLSDIITCGTEKFYVMENDGIDITMLSMYVLSVGYDVSCDWSDTQYIVDSTCTGSEVKSSNVLQYYNKKSSYGSYSYMMYGLTHFEAGAQYWRDLQNDILMIDGDYLSEGRDYPYVYGNYESNLIYPYIESYKEELEKMGVEVKNARLISYEEFVDIKSNKSNPKWLSGYYWTGSTEDSYEEWIYTDYSVIYGYVFRIMGNDIQSSFGSYSDSRSGVRPVITIPKFNISNK